MFNWLKNLLKKKEEKVEKKIEEINKIEYDIRQADLSRISLYNGTLDDIDPTKKTLVLVDDYAEMKTLFKNMILDIKKEHDIDLEKDFNIVLIIGDNCAKDCILFSKKYKIDYGVLDITMREILKKKDGTRGKVAAVDGIDLGREIKEKHQHCELSFLTAHNLDEHTSKFNNFLLKHEKFFGTTLIERYYNKLDPERCKSILNLIRKK